MEEQRPVDLIRPSQADQHAQQDHPQSEDEQHPEQEKKQERRQEREQEQEQEQEKEQEQKPVEPIQPDRPLEMIKVAVMLERPSSEELAQHDRGEKYQILRSNTAELRGGLVAWIEEQGLSEEVSRIGEATVFNMLFVVCTPRVAEELTRAPGVVSVSPSEDFRVDLLQT
jgi:hypothetical protein